MKCSIPTVNVSHYHNMFYTLPFTVKAGVIISWDIGFSSTPVQGHVHEMGHKNTNMVAFILV